MPITPHFNKRCKVTIFIPTKNAGDNFKKVLDSIYSQSEKDFEIHITDSGSTDNTKRIIQNYPKIIFEEIKPCEFGHAKTRNLAAQKSKSEYIIFLSQDAIPFDKNWLSELLIPFTQKNTQLVATFSKQTPYMNANISEIFFYNYYFNSIHDIDKNNNGIKNYFFSNVSSCIKREILIQFPFDETLHFSEDKKFILDIIKHTYIFSYNPKSIVTHSHNYSYLQMFKRYFDMALSLKTIFKDDFKILKKQGIQYFLLESLFVLKKRPLFIFQLFFYDLIKMIATSLGEYAFLLPSSIKKHISSIPYFFMK